MHQFWQLLTFRVFQPTRIFVVISNTTSLISMLLAKRVKRSSAVGNRLSLVVVVDIAASPHN
ncbi:hypothetical protein [Brasilonema bromeliae]|uniref:hypothetical protein n=1 Tax=Brasilonema bromeliae TaxID=383615 RepID=UPI00145E407F